MQESYVDIAGSFFKVLIWGQHIIPVDAKLEAKYKVSYEIMIYNNNWSHISYQSMRNITNTSQYLGDKWLQSSCSKNTELRSIKKMKEDLDKS
jgi:hypothetical protein